MQILVISGSTREQSLNTRLGRLVARVRPQDTVSVDAALDRLPFYDGDVEAAGAPAVVADLREAVAQADLVVFSTPEYNGTTPGLLVNAVDWLSRPYGRSALRGKPVLVLSASPGRGGGVRAAAHLRELLARVGATVSPGQLAVPEAGRRLGGSEADPALLAELGDVLAGALDAVAEETAA